MTKIDLNIALKAPFAKRYDNFIGGEWCAPKSGRYFENISPITGLPVCEIARSDAADIEAALDAAHAAKDAWGKTSPAERALILNRIADRMQENLDTLALAETWDNGKPTVLEGHNKMRVFQEEIFGPVVSVTTFKDEDDALALANDTLYGLGAGVWSRDANTCYRFGRAIQAGRVWTNCYHAYPAHAAFGGYKQSGIGRENHKMMLDHYQQTKNMLVSYSPKKLGFF